MQIVKVPNEVLTTPAKAVLTSNKKVLELIEEMKKILLATDNPKGVGLAAPQVGQSVRLFITKPTVKAPFTVFINPQIIWQSEEKTDGVPERDKKFEGCLSIPNVWGMVHRAKKIRVKYQQPTANPSTSLRTSYQLTTKTRTFSGFLATIIQHETDHINGILFTQRVLEQKEKLYKVKGKDEKGDDVFEEIEL